MSTTIKYNNETIATATNQSKLLKTAGTYMEGDVLITDSSPTYNTQAKTGINPSTSSQTITPDSGYDALSSVQINAMPTGTAGTPTATKGTVSNHSVSVTPSVTNTTGYISGGTKTGTAVTVSASELVSGNLSPSNYGIFDCTNYATFTIAGGGAGTPVATKGAVSNHSISVTPSVTNVRGWIESETKTGTAITVSASELVSGSETKTANGTYDVTNLAQVVVNVSGGGGGEYGWLGQNATVVQTYNSQTYSLSETSYSTWTPSTTSTKILDAQTLGQFTLTDLDTYDYYLLETFNFTPVRVAGAYTTTTIERYLWMVVYGFYKGYSTADAVASQTPNATNGYSYATRWLFYYTSTGVLGFVSASNYGVFPYNDTVSSDYTTIIKNITTPQINARCSSSYFTTARAAELDQDESKFEITAKIIRVDRPSITSKPSTILADLYSNPLT